jgi:hypothetical protein
MVREMISHPNDDKDSVEQYMPFYLEIEEEV